jgi:vancomycin resistance protein YoaR
MDDLNYDIDKNKKSKLFILITLLVILTFSLYFFVSFITLESNKIAPETNLIKNDGTFESLGGLKLNEAHFKANQLAEEYLSGEMILNSPPNTIKAGLKDIGIFIDTKELMGKIDTCAYGNDILESIKKHIDFHEKILMSDFIKLDSKKLNEFVDKSLLSIETKPEDASLYVDNGALIVKKEVQGYAVNRQEFEKAVLSAASSSLREINIPLDMVPASVREEDIKKMMPSKIVSTYTSYYGGSDTGRKENIRLGAALINNILLKPGDEFEFWKYVGETTPERGFKIAGVYQNGRPATDIGGGLCQVSTTLYNAALLADLKITKRSPHSLPVHYVPLGLDATVSTGVYTLSFVNNTQNYILIKSRTDGRNITFDILGVPLEGKTVKVYSKIISNNTADAYKDIYMDGKLVKHEYIGRSKYR